MRKLLRSPSIPKSWKSVRDTTRMALWICFSYAIACYPTYAAESKLKVSVLRMWKVSEVRIPTGSVALNLDGGRLTPTTKSKVAASGNIMLNLMLYLQPLTSPVSVAAKDIGLQAGRKTWSALALNEFQAQLAFMPVFAKSVEIPQPGAVIVMATIEVPEALVANSILAVKGQQIGLLKSTISSEESMRQFAAKLEEIYSLEGQPVEFGKSGKLTAASSSASQTSTRKRSADGELRRPICGQQDCSGPGTIPPTKARTGDYCSGDADCKSGGMVCWKAQCRKLSPSGASCLGNLDCAEGLLCLKGACSSGDTLRAAKGSAKGSCSRDADCKSGMVCWNVQCRKVSPIGATCEQDSDCGVGLTCWKNECSEEETIRPVARPAAARNTCVSDTDCTSGMVCWKTECRKSSPVGAVCTANSDCAGGLMCWKGECTADEASPIGATCTQNSDCAVGLMCWKSECSDPWKARFQPQSLR